MVAIEDANGWTAVSSRHSDGSNPKRRITFSSNSFWPSSGKVTPRTGRSPSARAAATSGTCSSFSRSKTARTSAVFIPGSKSSRSTS